MSFSQLFQWINLAERASILQKKKKKKKTKDWVRRCVNKEDLSPVCKLSQSFFSSDTKLLFVSGYLLFHRSCIVLAC